MENLINRTITESENKSLIQIPNDKEILMALNSIPSLKASGPNGIPSLFHKHNGETVKPLLLSPIKSFFISGHILREWNNTFICLIPKRQGASTVKDFTPISLCNACYKGRSQWRHQGNPDKQGGPQISHLMFAYDLLILSKATKANIRNVKSILDKFCSWSGQEVNCSKSGIFFSKNTSADTKRNAKAVLGMRKLKEDAQYLGNPMFIKKKRNDSLQFLIDKIKGKLTSWKAKAISWAGRATLINSVINNTPTYSMSLFRLPKSTLSSNYKVTRRFWWGTTKEEGSYYAPKNWDSICQPRLKGGLGFRRAKDSNEAMLSETTWALTKTNNSLADRDIKAKYGNFLNSVNRSSPSPIWKGLQWCEDIIQSNVIPDNSVKDIINFVACPPHTLIDNSLDKTNFSLYAAVTFYQLWNSRNDVLHASKPGDLHQTIKRIKYSYLKHMRRSQSDRILEGSPSALPLQLDPSQEPTGLDWSVINTYASWTNSSSCLSGILQYSCSPPTLSWFKISHEDNSLQAEAHATLLTVTIAAERGLTKIWLRCDALLLVDGILHPRTSPWEIRSLVSYIISILIAFRIGFVLGSQGRITPSLMTWASSAKSQILIRFVSSRDIRTFETMLSLPFFNL
ncbi:hypothetical protein CRG98_011489 [Punica granatum]|uniref:RNase H type-1 domain-containing protein n=1 Tax=Punica granatum TaxID=22663 RepID=A0A2I0KI85_PUNGR|nr:hypothetical protein CRG98_011489 [Punica granatum]